MLTWPYYAAWIGPPFLLSLRSGVRARAIASTIAITGLVGTLAVHFLAPEDLVGGITFMLFILPCFVVLTAALMATRQAGGWRNFVPAVLLGILGHIVSIVVMFLLDAYAPLHRGWSDLGWAAVAAATPAIYSSCGAVLASTRKPA